MRMIAIDVGFSKRRPTIGYAAFVDGILYETGLVGDVEALPPADVAVIEWVEHVWRGRVSDALHLNFEAGRIAGRYPEHVTVTSSQWGGSRPKKVKAAHARKALTVEEMSTVKASGHVWDAIGIGLWYLGRM